MERWLIAQTEPAGSSQEVWDETKEGLCSLIIINLHSWGSEGTMNSTALGPGQLFVTIMLTDCGKRQQAVLNLRATPSHSCLGAHYLVWS